MADIGDKISITLNKRKGSDRKSKIKGVLMPKPKAELLSVKLDSGYNLILNEKDIKEIKILRKVSKKRKKKSPFRSAKTKQKILILHCGGTIASKVDYSTGAVKAIFTPSELLELFPELKELADIKSRIISNMLSEEMRFKHYNIIAEEIYKNKKDYTGIIITHGTDTLHYTSAALAFALGKIDLPVILVGAQRSSDRASSDAHHNLIAAVNFIVKSGWKGVGICMHKSTDDLASVILGPFNSRKMHTSRRDAFKAIGRDMIAEISRSGEIKIFSKSSFESDSILKLFNERLKIGLVKSHPNFYAEELKAYEDFDGLVIEGTGLGHLPVEVIDEYTKEHDKIYKELKRISKRIPVVITSQCISGRINLDVYSTGRKIKDLGIIGNLADLTPETAFIKLAWLLSSYKERYDQLFLENLRGEMNTRSQEFELL